MDRVNLIEILFMINIICHVTPKCHLGKKIGASARDLSIKSVSLVHFLPPTRKNKKRKKRRRIETPRVI